MKTDFETNSSVRFRLKRTWKIVFVLKQTEPEFRCGFRFGLTSSDSFQLYSGLFWLIANDSAEDGYRQVVFTTVCHSVGSKCPSSRFQPPSFCTQQYSYQRLVAVRPLQDSDQSPLPEIRIFPFPTCCTCSY